MTAIASAEKMKKHLHLNMPSMQGFQIANAYMLGQNLVGGSTGRILGSLVVSCWETSMAPVLVLESTILGDNVISSFAEITQEYAAKHGGAELGIYIANAMNRETKEKLTQKINGEYRIWYIYTSSASPTLD